MSVWKDCYKWMAQMIPERTQTLLDIGCGTGLELDEIFRLRPDLAVTGIDLEQAMLDRLRKKHGRRNLRCIRGDYFQVPFGEACFDTAVSFETLHHFKPEDKELSTNNCCKFMAIFIVFPGFCLKQLQQLFSDNS